MAVIRDMIPAFELFQPTTVEDALALLDRYGADAWVLAGGLDSLDWLKDRIKRPEAVVELGQIESMKGIRVGADGVEVGALTTLSEVSEHPDINERFRLLAMAAGEVATPQIRNQGTIGGNICQDTRCWYYRGGWPCRRAGGDSCYAMGRQSMNREHAVLGTAIGSLVAAAEADEPDVTALRTDGTDFLVRLSRHRQAGSDLMFDAYDLDVGGET